MLEKAGFLASHKPSSSTKARGPRLFYGYVIVLATSLILMTSWGMQNTFGIFFKPILSEFGWTRAETSGAYSLNAVLVGVFGIFAGRLNDRFGPRLVITIGGLFIGSGYLLMSQINAIWQMYLFYGVLISIGLASIVVPLLSTLARWFIKRRGLAIGLAVSGTGVGTILFPPLANQLISNFDWRTSYVIIGLIVLVVIITIAQFLRRDPSQMGIQAYGAEAAKTESPNMKVQGLIVQEALRTRQFWLICVIGFCAVFCINTVTVHVVPYATDIGIPPASAATILSACGLVVIGGKIGLGSILDRVGSKRVMIIVFIVISVSFLWLLLANKLWMLYVFAVAFGVIWGGYAVAQSPLVADFSGMKSHGAIFGLASFSTQIGGAIGSLMPGRIYDISGSYYWAFMLCVILGVIGLVLSILLKNAR